MHVVLRTLFAKAHAKFVLKRIAMNRELLYLYLFVFLLSIPLISSAQGPGGRGGGGTPKPITGTVVDPMSGQALEYATIGVYKKRDSSLVAGGITGADGTFRLEVPGFGRYYLTASFIGFKELVIDSINPANYGPVVELGTITLESDAENIATVDIVAEKSQMQMKLDKRVFTVGKDLSNAGGTAEDVLSNIPSVEVDVEGNVSLRGSGNVRILVDGKPSGMTGSDALKYFQADQIERVEVVTNPSARYDAEGEVGIINIILKKNKREGFNGSVAADVGYPQLYGGSINLNYRGKFFNLFTNYSIRYREGPGSGNYYQENYAGDTTSYLVGDRTHNRGGLTNNVRIGSDFFWKDVNTLTIAGSYRYSMGDNSATINYQNLNNAAELLSTSERNDDEEENEQNIEASISYDRAFKKKDQKLSINASWFISDDTEDSRITEVFSTGNDIEQRSHNEEDEMNFLAQADYVHPILGLGKLEVGTRNTFRTINNNYKVEELNSGEWITLDGFADNFSYQENIYAAYIMMGLKHGKFSWQAGVRSELSDINITSTISGESNRKTYIGFFPSAHLSYEFNEQNTIQLSYSRRLSRPRFRWLLPFSSFSDARNLWVGNPDLNPEYTNSVELGYLKYWKTGSLLTSVYYRYRTGVITRVNVVVNEEFTQTLPINLADEHNVGLELSLTQDLFKWWSLTAGSNIYYFSQNGNYNNEDLSSSSLAGNFRVVSKWKLPKSIGIQASVNYQSPRQSAQGMQKSMTHADLGASMDLLKGKATLSFNVRDLFNTRKRRSITETNDLYSENEFQWRQRSFVLSFSYRFGTQNKSKNRQGGGGGGDMDEF